ncbi:uncharacterized protein N7482_005961 [Penicillium canariense]|uniref:Malate dehydrogenase n=1 Tax=Penicillium canariense TaxID=189055 RepID=A0A9W9I5U4_9EURO|nr:uncharacterized protein N7482_005961 [Penicillium canariense]KAJ5167180.1 hypothetical protein N7482_005961 [Penicillium canariense]
MRLTLILLSLVTVSLAAPANFFDGAYDFSDDLAGFYAKVSQHISRVQKSSATPSATCDLSSITLPSYASGLPSPDGLTPMHVALGRGTQNYTCADSTSKSTPKAIGAVANLYNVTCMSADYPDILEMLPNVAYKISLPTNEYATLPPANIDLMGHHFFYDATTPEFNLDTVPLKQYGIAMTKKQDQISAPSDAIAGQYGAVAWLYLTTTDGTVGKYKSVYRVNTASGSPPDTCQGMPSSFEIQYSANYYFFGN